MNHFRRKIAEQPGLFPEVPTLPVHRKIRRTLTVRIDSALKALRILANRYDDGSATLALAMQNENAGMTTTFLPPAAVETLLAALAGDVGTVAGIALAEIPGSVPMTLSIRRLGTGDDRRITFTTDTTPAREAIFDARAVRTFAGSLK